MEEENERKGEIANNEKNEYNEENEGMEESEDKGGKTLTQSSLGMRIG